MIIVIQNQMVIKMDCDKIMLDGMKTSKSSTIGEKLSKYLITYNI